MERCSHDVIIIGCGAAGLRAAIAAAERGSTSASFQRPAMASGSSTVMSRGHFAGARPGWTPEQHRESTLRAGKGLNDGELADTLIRDAPGRLDEMVRSGPPGRDREGPVVRVGPPSRLWGKEIVRCLLEWAADMGVRFRSGLTAARIRFSEGAAGVLCFARRQRRVGPVYLPGPGPGDRRRGGPVPAPRQPPAHARRRVCPGPGSGGRSAGHGILPVSPHLDG